MGEEGDAAGGGDDPSPDAGDEPSGGTSSSPSSARRYISSVLEGWKGFVAAAGAVGAALVAYDLAKSLGKGDATGWEHVIVLVSIAAFATGAGLLLSIPISLTTRSRATLLDAVELYEKGRTHWWRPTRPVVGRDVLYGRDNVKQFYDELSDLLARAMGYWTDQTAGKLPLGLQQQLKVYIAQREQAQLHVAAQRVAASSKRASLYAGLGLLLVVVGYGNAAWITNHSIREAELADKATDVANQRSDKAAEVTNKRIDSVLEVYLTELAEDLGSPPLIPRLPSTVTVRFPDEKTATDVLPAGDLDASCWAAGRVGTAYDLSASNDPESPLRIVSVAFAGTSGTCPAFESRIDPAWIQPTGDESVQSTSVADGGGDADGDG